MIVKANSLKILYAFMLFVPRIITAQEEIRCPIRAQSASAHSDLIQAASLIGNENRQSAEEFADEQNPEGQIRQAFGASGVFRCGGFESTAQVTGATNVLTTAAHNFLYDDCSLRENLDQCYFYKPESPEKKYYIDPTSLKTGKDAGGCFKQDHYYDWATVKLKEHVDGVTPYEIPETDPNYQKDSPILMVSYNDANLTRLGANFQVCRIRDIYKFSNHPIQTDCDTGGRASGAAQFLLPPSGLSLEPSKLILSAINVAEIGADKAGQDYNSENHYNISVPLETDFLAAVKQLSGR